MEHASWCRSGKRNLASQPGRVRRNGSDRQAPAGVDAWPCSPEQAAAARMHQLMREASPQDADDHVDPQPKPWYGIAWQQYQHDTGAEEEAEKVAERRDRREHRRELASALSMVARPADHDTCHGVLRMSATIGLLVYLSVTTEGVWRVVAIVALTLVLLMLGGGWRDVSRERRARGGSDETRATELR